MTATLDVGGAVHRVPPTLPVGEPALVFLHEGLGSIELWRSFPDDVRAAAGRRTVVSTPARLRPLHAGAAAVAGVATCTTRRSIVLPALLERLGVERPVLIGHSDGALDRPHPRRRRVPASPAWC